MCTCRVCMHAWSAPDSLPECKITAGHWPISDHFSKMADQNFSMVHSLCTHDQSNSWGIGKWPTISNFLFSTLPSQRGGGVWYSCLHVDIMGYILHEDPLSANWRWCGGSQEGARGISEPLSLHFYQTPPPPLGTESGTETSMHACMNLASFPGPTRPGGLGLGMGLVWINHGTV